MTLRELIALEDQKAFDNLPDWQKNSLGTQNGASPTINKTGMSSAINPNATPVTNGVALNPNAGMVSDPLAGINNNAGNRQYEPRSDVLTLNSKGISSGGNSQPSPPSQPQAKPSITVVPQSSASSQVGQAQPAMNTASATPLSNDKFSSVGGSPSMSKAGLQGLSDLSVSRDEQFSGGNEMATFEPDKLRPGSTNYNGTPSGNYLDRLSQPGSDPFSDRVTDMGSRTFLPKDARATSLQSPSSQLAFAAAKAGLSPDEYKRRVDASRAKSAARRAGTSGGVPVSGGLSNTGNPAGSSPAGGVPPGSIPASPYNPPAYSPPGNVPLPNIPSSNTPGGLPGGLTPEQLSQMQNNFDSQLGDIRSDIENQIANQDPSSASSGISAEGRGILEGAKPGLDSLSSYYNNLMSGNYEDTEQGVSDKAGIAKNLEATKDRIRKDMARRGITDQRVIGAEMAKAERSAGSDFSGIKSRGQEMAAKGLPNLGQLASNFRQATSTGGTSSAGLSALSSLYGMTGNNQSQIADLLQQIGLAG